MRRTDLLGPAAERLVRPRRGLPGSRAVVGGLLVAVAAVGVFAAWSGANHGPTTRYVVAAHTNSAGTVLQRADLKTVAIDLPDAVASRSFANVSGLDDAVTLGPLEAGELVQSGNVLPGRTSKPRPEISFGIDAERAVAGTLRPGDRIDILVTYGTGAGSVTQVVSTDATVLAVDGGNRNGLSDARRQVLSVALASSDNILEVTNAARAGEITVARASGVKDRPEARSFQPDVAESAGGSAPTPTTATPDTTASTVPGRNP
ncbi:MAG: RcpC/CpaB family pilus assembly protein [Actinomycetota bacterium]|nr:RcpC/CpaB family pilus assembly protein [Actinomycetota bacterium]